MQAFFNCIYSYLIDALKRLITAFTALSATALISSSLRVFSSDWRVTETANDFLSSSISSPSYKSKIEADLANGRHADLTVCRTSAAFTFWSKINAKSRFTAWYWLIEKSLLDFLSFNNNSNSTSTSF